MNDLTVVEPGSLAIVTPLGTITLPRIIVDAGPDAARHVLEFFIGRLANDHTRAAYARAAGQFLTWCETRGLALRQIAPLHVAAYIRTHRGAVPTVKQHLAAIRMLGDWLVVAHILPTNPAAAVRGPKHVVTTGATPVLSGEEARALLDVIDVSTLVGLRDRALIGVMVYSFARVSAVLGMLRQDYFPQGKRWWLRLHEKGGKRHDVPAHHVAEAYLDAYLEAAGALDPKDPLFQSVDRTRRLTGRALGRREALEASNTGRPPRICHRRRAAIRFARRGSRRISRTAAPSNTRNRSPRMPPRRRRSCTTAPAIRSRSRRSTASSFDPSEGGRGRRWQKPVTDVERRWGGESSPSARLSRVDAQEPFTTNSGCPTCSIGTSASRDSALRASSEAVDPP